MQFRSVSGSSFNLKEDTVVFFRGETVIKFKLPDGVSIKRWMLMDSNSSCLEKPL